MLKSSDLHDINRKKNRDFGIDSSLVSPRITGSYNNQLSVIKLLFPLSLLPPNFFCPPFNVASFLFIVVGASSQPSTWIVTDPYLDTCPICALLAVIV